MIGRRRHADDEVVASPWATGDILADPAPEFDWETQRDAAGDPSTAPPGPTRRKRVLIAVGCVAALVVAALVLRPDGDEPIDEADNDAPATTLDTLPDADVTPDQDEIDPEPDDDDTSTDVLAAPLDTGSGGGTGGDITSIELPASIADITQPTEIVMIADGHIVTLSLPSGTVRHASDGTSIGDGSNLVVAPDAAAWYGVRGLSIVPRIGPPLNVNLSDGAQGGFLSGWRTDGDGATVFIADVWNDSNEQYAVTVDGEFSPYELDPAGTDLFSIFGGLRSGIGDEVINDAGGVYVIGADDSVERISNGRALASNERFVLIRECDEALTCGYSVLERSTGERSVSPITAADLGLSYNFDLSPDGTATLTLDFDNGRRRLVDLATGAVVTELGSVPSAGSNTLWAADGSGVFEANPTGPGIVFIDRVTGESTSFATELGDIRGLGTRSPDDELASIEAEVNERPLTFSEDLSDATGIEVVVLGESGSMAFLDLDVATASVWSVPPVNHGSNTPELFASGRDVAVLPPGVGAGFVSELGSTQPLDAMAPGFPRFPGPTPGLVWSPVERRSDQVNHQLLGRDGSIPESGELAVALPNSELLGDDGNGLLVARVGGSVFVVGADPAEKLTDGQLLALGPNHALVRSCDGELNCAVLRLERSSGTAIDPSSTTPGVGDVLSSLEPIRPPDQSPRSGGTMSPDGGSAIVRGSADGSSVGWVFIDFVSGTSFPIPAPTVGQSIVWSADSSAAVYVGANEVHVLDRTAEQLVTVEGLGSVRAITAVDPEFAVADG